MGVDMSIPASLQASTSYHRVAVSTVQDLAPGTIGIPDIREPILHKNEYRMNIMKNHIHHVSSVLQQDKKDSLKAPTLFRSFNGAPTVQRVRSCDFPNYNFKNVQNDK